ncbi:MAG TPA: Hsp20/alpha crystallin family protein [Bacteroidia bacterium]|nr:Hsp20/alpha crystallin family protein [Bacteroidia bacterium]
MTLIRFKSDSPAKAFDRSPNFNEFFNDVFDNMINGDFRKPAVPSVNISESENAYHLDMAAPGFSKEEFSINLEKDVLTISAEKKAEKSEADKKYSRREFSYSSFKRTFTLPETVNAEKIQASYENGIMHLDFPKKEEAKPQPARSISVN